MSNLTHPTTTIPHIHVHRSWLVALLLATVVALSLAFVLVVGGEDSTPDVAPGVSSLSVDGVRYDGGPEEGSAAVSSRETPQPGVRYDGGPEEGSAAIGR